MPLIVLQSVFALTANSQHLDASSRGPISSAYFDLNIHGISKNTGWPAVPFDSWRSFHFNWKDLEPQKDVWDFARSDGDVQQAAEHGVQLLAVLQTIPSWAGKSKDPRNPQARSEAAVLTVPGSYSLWAEYVRTVSTRYKGKIHYYELWNEPENLQNFTTSPELLTRLNQIAYQTLKQVDPSIQVVSSAMSSGDPDHARPPRQLTAFLQSGALQVSDIIAYHFYAIPPRGESEPQIPESILKYADNLNSQLRIKGQQKPIWATEMGWYILNDDKNLTDAPSYLGKPLSPYEGAAYLARAYILGWVAGVSRIYWYAWRDDYFGMTESSGATKKPEVAYRIIQKWLIGSTVSTCDRSGDGLWTCVVTQSNGLEAMIIWNESQRSSIRVNPAWKMRRTQSLSGTWSTLAGTINVDVSPILLVH